MSDPKKEDARPTGAPDPASSRPGPAETDARPDSKPPKDPPAPGTTPGTASVETPPPLRR